ncbi:hypothetical protein SAMN05216241_10910 [Limimonas halophila]|uniref:CRISPR-associated protein Cas2 n=1 Tax=Limimonas halophila TaxID=1082479 RepID=A0A1G7TBP6_9PROT|nr:hypothetical protein [Limimonas halophila]SDG32787.1 hypothetical protein SAMN05216241_10910 [Limimonas halophila]
MAIYLVTLDLTRDDKAYRGLTDALKRYVHCRPQARVWLLDSEAKASRIRDELRQHVHPKDGIIVAQLKPQAAMMGETCHAWLKDGARRW